MKNKLISSKNLAKTIHFLVKRTDVSLDKLMSINGLIGCVMYLS